MQALPAVGELVANMGEGEHPAQAGGTVAVKTRDVAVPVVGDVLLGLLQALTWGTAAVVRRIGQALQGVVVVGGKQIRGGGGCVCAGVGLHGGKHIPAEVVLRAVSRAPSVGVVLRHLHHPSAVVVVVPLRAGDAAVRRRRAVGVRRRVKDLALEYSLEHTQRNITLHGRETLARMRKGQNMMSEKQTSFEPLDPKLKPLLRICGLLNI